MKKSKFFGLLFASSLVLAACGNGGDKASNTEGSENTGKKYTLTVNNFEPAGANIDSNIFSEWEKLVEEKTDGQVDVDVQHGGVLGPITTLHTDLEAGLFDVGLVIANYAYDTKFFPYSIVTLPFAAENSRQAAELLTEFAEKTVDPAELGVKVGAPFTSDGYDLASSKPLDVSDFKGLKMRASTASESKFVQALGGAPVGLKVNEAYEGLQKGTVNTSFASATQVEAYRLFEVAPHIKRISFTYTPLIPAINNSYFEKLPEDLQTLFDEELMPALSEIAIDAFERVTEESYERVAEQVKGKGEITVATEEEMNLLRGDASKAAWESWITDANDRGYDGQALVDSYFEILDANNITRPY